MLSDHLGSTSALVAQNGALVSTNYYHPYGDARSPLSPLTTKRFTGQYHEAALGLYFYNARWYDPLLGRFTQPARGPLLASPACGGGAQPVRPAITEPVQRDPQQSGAVYGPQRALDCR